jgi:hypothetical protein
MAFTINANSRVSLGSAHFITGTLETHTTPGTDAILPGSTIVAFWINYNDDDVDVTLPRVHINASDFLANADSYAGGSIHHDSSVIGDTLTWSAIYK